MAALQFLKLDGIQGESVVKGHEREIELVSWGWGETNKVVVSGSSSRSGKVQPFDVLCSMRVNKSSPLLFLACARGDVIRRAELDVIRSGRVEDFVKWEFADVMITSCQTKTDAGDPIPLDQFSFTFSRVQVTYTVLKSDGSAGGTVVTSYDFLRGKSPAVAEPSKNELNTESSDSAAAGVENQQWLATPQSAGISGFNVRQEIRGNQRYLGLEVIRPNGAPGVSSAETSKDLQSWIRRDVLEEVLEETPAGRKVLLLVPMDKVAEFLRVSPER